MPTLAVFQQYRGVPKYSCVLFPVNYIDKR